jgi:CheY-like chemotaxis protein
VGVGTGLGLSLVHGIVSEVGGAIDVRSTPGSGSVFTAYLPRSGDAPEQPPDEMPELPRGNNESVLLVDDELPLVLLTAENLVELGYAPVSFSSSRKALEAFRANPMLYDAVIADERMPGLTGSALLREMHALRPEIPKLLVSGNVGPELVMRAREAGVNEVLKKPLSVSDMAASLARALAAARADQRWMSTGEANT